MNRSATIASELPAIPSLAAVIEAYQEENARLRRAVRAAQVVLDALGARPSVDEMLDIVNGEAFASAATSVRLAALSQGGEK